MKEHILSKHDRLEVSHVSFNVLTIFSTFTFEHDFLGGGSFILNLLREFYYTILSIAISEASSVTVFIVDCFFKQCKRKYVRNY